MCSPRPPGEGCLWSGVATLLKQNRADHPGGYDSCARPRLYAVLLLALGLCVLLWGTAYKTSLYRAPELGRAPAKLCTRASDVSKAQVDQAVDGLSAAAVLVWTAFVAARLEPAQQILPGSRVRKSRLSHWQRVSTVTHLHRPPPVLYRALA